MEQWKNYITSIADEVVKWRRHIHENPELGFHEYDTAEFIKETLKEIGLSEIQHIGKTGILAIIRGEKGIGKCIALRADIDALPSEEKTNLPYASKRPGAAHLCGHDIHTCILLGTAKTLWQYRKEFAGTVKLIFQPAEELLGGAKQMINAGVLENPDVEAIFGLHCWPDIAAGELGIYAGAMMASANNFKITVQGKQGHGAHPHRAIDPVVISAQIINSLQILISREITPLEPAVLTIGKIHGGSSSNTIPETVEMEGTFRTLSSEVTNAISQGIKRIATGIAANLRGSAVVEITDGLPPLVNDLKYNQILSDCFSEVFGEEKVIRLATPSMGSEDFSLYLGKIPGYFYRLGTGRADSSQNHPLHSQEFCPDEFAVPTGILAMCALVRRTLR